MKGLGGALEKFKDAFVIFSLILEICKLYK